MSLAFPIVNNIISNCSYEYVIKIINSLLIKIENIKISFSLINVKKYHKKMPFHKIMFPDNLIAPQIWKNNIWIESFINSIQFIQIQENIEFSTKNLKKEIDYVNYLGVNRYIINLDIMINFPDIEKILIKTKNSNFMLTFRVKFSHENKIILSQWKYLQNLKNKLSDFQIIIYFIESDFLFVNDDKFKFWLSYFKAENKLGYELNHSELFDQIKNKKIFEWIYKIISLKYFIILGNKKYKGYSSDQIELMIADNFKICKIMKNIEIKILSK